MSAITLYLLEKESLAVMSALSTEGSDGLRMRSQASILFSASGALALQFAVPNRAGMVNNGVRFVACQMELHRFCYLECV